MLDWQKMSLTTETNSTTELEIIQKLNSIHEQFEEIYLFLDSNKRDAFIKGKMALAIEIVRTIKKDYGI